MKKLVILIALIFASQSLASPVYHPSGSNLSYGVISYGHTIISDISNPAAGAELSNDEHGLLRFGAISSLGAGYEIGKIDNLITQVDDTIDLFTDGLSESDPRIPSINTSLTLQENIDNVLVAVNTLINDTNTLMVSLEDNGYFKGFASLHIPAFPLLITHKALPGSFVLDINTSVIGQASFLSDAINPLSQADVENQVTQSFNNNQSVDLGDLLTSDTTVTIKGAVITEMALGYSLLMWDRGDGKLFAGSRIKYYRTKLSRFAQRIDTASNQSLGDIFDNNKDDNFIENSKYAIDFGLLWVTDYYRTGITLNNINQPEFKFNTLDVSEYIDPAFPSRLLNDGNYAMDFQVHLEAAHYASNKNWIFGVELDANPASDPVGQKYQWASINAINTQYNWPFPTLRFGYRANLAGSKINYITAGVTFLKVLNIDIAYSLEKIKIEPNDLTAFDGTKPRSMIVNFGLELVF